MVCFFEIKVVGIKYWSSLFESLFGKQNIIIISFLIYLSFNLRKAKIICFNCSVTFLVKPATVTLLEIFERRKNIAAICCIFFHSFLVIPQKNPP